MGKVNKIKAKYDAKCAPPDRWDPDLCDALNEKGYYG